MNFAGDGLNSSPGVGLQQGDDSHVPTVSVDTVLISCLSFDDSDLRQLLLRICHLQFRLPHAMPQAHGQTSHDGYHGDLFLFGIACHQSLKHLSGSRIMLHVHPTGLA